MSQARGFLAQSSDVRLLANPLRALPAVDSEAICQITTDCLQFFVFPKPDYWVSAWIQRDWFTEFVCQGTGADEAGTTFGRTNAADETMGRAEAMMAQQGPEQYKIALDLRLLLECLEIFGGPSWGVMSEDKDRNSVMPDVFHDRKTTSLTAFKLSFADDCESMSLMLEENEVVAECTLNLLAVEDDRPVSLNNGNAKLARMIADSEWFEAVLQSIHPSCERVRISFTPETHEGHAVRPGAFHLEADTDVGSVGAHLLSTANNVTNYVCCEAGAGPYSYSFSAFTNLVRTLQAASKISLSMDSRGIFAVHCLVPVSVTVWKETKAKDRRMTLPSIVYHIHRMDDPDF